ncbi:MAG: hypothetical protein ACI4CT_02565 [Lachnospiraceae bacterium]
MFKYTYIFLVGGFIYYNLEILWRGYSHVSMFLCGGVCLILIGLLNQGLHIESVFLQMLCSSLIITGIEWVAGYIVNIRMKLNVWDYSGLPLNIQGQICLLYSFLWFFLSFAAILLDDVIRHFIFGETWPVYHLF